MNEAGRSRQGQPAGEAKRGRQVLEVALVDGTRMLGKQTLDHGALP